MAGKTQEWKLRKVTHESYGLLDRLLAESALTVIKPAGFPREATSQYCMPGGETVTLGNSPDGDGVKLGIRSRSKKNPKYFDEILRAYDGQEYRPASALEDDPERFFKSQLR